MVSQTSQAAEELVVSDEQVIRNEFSFTDPTAIKADSGVDPDLDKQADEYVANLISASGDQDARESGKSAMEDFGLELQQKSSKQSSMLKRPINSMSKRSAEGGDVANALVDLKMTVEDLDPAKFDINAGWATRLLGYIPGIGTPLKRYFSKFESAQTVINAIIESLTAGGEQLKRDNTTLKEDQKRMRELTLRLEKAIKLAQLMDTKLVYMVERDIAGDAEKVKFVQEELLFPLRQRIMDLQQQLVVSQQGIIALEVVIRNNKELIRGVNRALNVTVSALEVAVTVAVALNDQKIVLDKINALNTTTNNLIKGTAERLKTQGVEIHKQAASTQIDMESLKSAFTDISSAMDDLSKFRVEALPKMSSTIAEMDKLTDEAEKSIQKMEKGSKVAPSFNIEV